ncbi:MAG: hypothetical protein NVS3B20_12290 [Polyangiales bacterium]
MIQILVKLKCMSTPINDAVPAQSKDWAGSSPRHAFLWRTAFCALTLALFAGCPDPDTPANRGSGPRSEVTTKWLNRAKKEYESSDLTEATDSVARALNGSPNDFEVRTLAAKIALSRLDFPGAIKALERVDGLEASSLRARAYWYSDDLPHAAEELSRALDDPDFKDPWAKPVRELAGTQGSGRKPFNLRDNAARLVEVHMPRDLGYALMVPCEIDGQPTMALAVTGVPEVILDSKARTSPGWVSVKFASGDRSMEFRDVPALVQDLSKYNAAQTTPIGAILGMNMLRRLHLTFDRRADQFILRREEPAPPPSVAKIPVSYVKAGAMVVRSTMRKEFELATGLFVDTGQPFTLALTNGIWKQLGVDVASLATYGGLAHGKLTDVHVGPLDVGPVDSFAGMGELEEKLKQFDGVEVKGEMGIGFLTAMRVTLADGGRTMWLETDEDTSMVLVPQLPASGPAKPGGSGPSTPAKSNSAPTASPTPSTTSAPFAPKAPAPSATPAASPSPSSSASPAVKTSPLPKPSTNATPSPK